MVPPCLLVWSGNREVQAWFGAGMQGQCFPLEQPGARRGLKPGIKVQQRRPAGVQLDQLGVIYT